LAPNTIKTTIRTSAMCSGLSSPTITEAPFVCLRG
jgi:hypothetical protein